MNSLSVALLRFSLAALVIGAGLGSWRLGGFPLPPPWIARFRAAHVHLMLFGWLLPSVLGVSYWILPRHPAGPNPRGSPAAARTAAWLLGSGVVLAAAGLLAGWGRVASAGRLLMLAGVTVFVRLLWPRARGIASD